MQNLVDRGLPVHSKNAALGIQLNGASNAVGAQHNIATGVQTQADRGTYTVERRIGYKAIRRAGVSGSDARAAI